MRYKRWAVDEDPLGPSTVSCYEKTGFGGLTEEGGTIFYVNKHFGETVFASSDLACARPSSPRGKALLRKFQLIEQQSETDMHIRCYCQCFLDRQKTPCTNFGAGMLLRLFGLFYNVADDFSALLYP